MTAPENTRERVAEVLAEHRLPGFTICGCGVQIGDPLATSSSWEAGHRAHVADALLPLIDTLLREQAEGIAAAIEGMKSFAHGKNPTSEAHLIGYGTARRLAARIARTFGGER